MSGPRQMSRMGVRRMGRAPADEVAAIAAHQEENNADSYDPNSVSDMILADKLADHDDPLEKIVRRDLSYRTPMGGADISSFHKRADQHAQELIGSHAPVDLTGSGSATYQIPGMGTMDLQPYREADPAPHVRVYRATWYPRGEDAHPMSAYAAALTREEMAHLLDEHGVPHDLRPKPDPTEGHMRNEMIGGPTQMSRRLPSALTRA